MQASVERLARAQEAREKEVSELREYLQRPIDPEDGQPLFTPRVGRGPTDGAARSRGGDEVTHAGLALYEAWRQGAEPPLEPPANTRSPNPLSATRASNVRAAFHRPRMQRQQRLVWR